MKSLHLRQAFIVKCVSDILCFPHHGWTWAGSDFLWQLLDLVSSITTTTTTSGTVVTGYVAAASQDQGLLQHIDPATATSVFDGSFTFMNNEHLWYGTPAFLGFELKTLQAAMQNMQQTSTPKPSRCPTSPLEWHPQMWPILASPGPAWTWRASSAWSSGWLDLLLAYSQNPCSPKINGCSKNIYHSEWPQNIEELKAFLVKLCDLAPSNFSLDGVPHLRKHIANALTFIEC